MSRWLDPVRRALDAAREPVAFFLRDDDVGWGDERLWALLDATAATATAIDLAVIPAALHTPLVDDLLRRAQSSPLAFHQHGWAHANHEPAGRKCEFGAARSPDDQRRDLVRGRRVMLEGFGAAAGRIFVPPWNRCTAVTARLLDDLGYAALARDRTAEPVPLGGLREIPVAVDWCARRPRSADRVDRDGRGDLLAAAVRERQVVGVMLHHEVLSDGDLGDLAQLCRLLAGHPTAVVGSMSDLLTAPAGAAPSRPG